MDKIGRKWEPVDISTKTKILSCLSVHNPEPLDSKIKVEIRKIVEDTANKI